MKNSADFHHCVRSKADFTVWHLECVSQKTRKLYGPEKPFLKLRPAYFVKLVFSYVVKGTKIKMTAKFHDTEHLRFGCCCRLQHHLYIHRWFLQPDTEALWVMLGIFSKRWALMTMSKNWYNLDFIQWRHFFVKNVRGVLTREDMERLRLQF